MAIVERFNRTLKTGMFRYFTNSKSYRYDGTMNDARPKGDFTFLAEDEVASFDLDATTKSDDYGCIL